MARIHSTNTKPEIILRSMIYGMGYRYRLHCKDLPGKPDIVFRGRKKVILVHGCFWHQHQGCKFFREPKSNTDYWVPKLAFNKKRDAQNVAALEGLGWTIMIVWECQLKDPEQLQVELTKFLQ